MMIKRKEYLDKLIAWKDKQLIKIVTGVRRCGKSMLLPNVAVKFPALAVEI